MVLKMGNLKLNCHTLKIGLPLGPPSPPLPLSGFGLLLLRVTVAVKQDSWSELSNGKCKFLLLIQLLISFKFSQ